MDALRIFAVLVNVAFILLNAWFLMYVYELEKRGCKCAIGWRRSFMELMMAVYVVMGVVTCFGPVAPVVSLLLAPLSLIYVIVTRQFINQMDSTACTCAETEAFKVLNVINWIQIGFLVLVFVLVALTLVASLTAGGGGGRKKLLKKV